MPTSRLTYEESCRRLSERGHLEGEAPPMPDHLPRHDDPEPLGVNFFRTSVEGEDLANLTLSRTFFGRSEINDSSFQNSDLGESNLCWNDFANVDFTDAILARSDIRSSVFDRVKFVRTDLRAADLRLSSFGGCVFDGALMDGTVLTRAQGAKLSLSDTQRQQIAWRDDNGPEPGGG